MRLWSLCLAMLASAGLLVAGGGGIEVVVLFDPGDPVRLLDGRFVSVDPTHRAIAFTIENNTGRALSTSQVWLTHSRFFTPAEMARNGNRIPSDCGVMARVDPALVIAPGERADVTMPVSAGCVLNPGHEHFFVMVHRIDGSGSRSGPAFWKRDPADFARLLSQAMPHP